LLASHTVDVIILPQNKKIDTKMKKEGIIKDINDAFKNYMDLETETDR
jgi:hypothetical protein